MNSSRNSSYNDFINGSKRRFLPFEELKRKHVIVTDIGSQVDFNILRAFYKMTGTTNSPELNKELHYQRYRPLNYNPFVKHTYCAQKNIKIHCDDPYFGQPDMMFTYKEFYNHYIKGKK